MNFKFLLVFFALNVLYIVKTRPAPFNGFKYPGITSTISHFFVDNDNNFFDNFFTSGGFAPTNNAWGGNNWGNNWGNNNNNNNKNNNKNNNNNNNGWNWGGDWWGLGGNNNNGGGNKQSGGRTSSTAELDTSKITFEVYDEDADVPVIN